MRNFNRIARNRQRRERAVIGKLLTHLQNLTMGMVNVEFFFCAHLNTKIHLVVELLSGV